MIISWKNEKGTALASIMITEGSGAARMWNALVRAGAKFKAKYGEDKSVILASIEGPEDEVIVALRNETWEQGQEGGRAVHGTLVNLMRQAIVAEGLEVSA